MPPIENLAEWQGKDVVDSGGEKVGKLVGVYYDAETDVTQFLLVEVGTLRKHEVLVPAGGVTASPDRLTVATDQQTVKDAPQVENGELDPEDEVRAFEHYGLPYQPAGTPSGRRLVRH